MAFELIFGRAIANSYLLYKENYATNKVTILQFRESLVQSLLIGMPFEKLKPDPRQKSTGQTKCKLVDHKLEETKAPARDIRRRCAGRYEKVRQQQQSKATSHMAANKIKALCPNCEKSFCLNCFNEKYHAVQPMKNSSRGGADNRSCDL